MKYFKFKDTFTRSNKDTSKRHNILYNLIKFILPQSNPDFEDKYDEVLWWYIEYDEENFFTNREIGLNKVGNIIVKGPFGRNLGFWTDSDLTMKNYEKWNIEFISPAIFNDLWEKM